MKNYDEKHSEMSFDNSSHWQTLKSLIILSDDEVMKSLEHTNAICVNVKWQGTLETP